MKKEFVQQLFEKFEAAGYDYDGVECWSARELQNILGYAKWHNFTKVIDKAKTSCEGIGVANSNHFPDVGKMIDLAKGAQRSIDDIALTRYASHVIPHAPTHTSFHTMHRSVESAITPHSPSTKNHTALSSIITRSALVAYEQIPPFALTQSQYTVGMTLHLERSGR